eukprot:228996-Hanusia_phi.AAC.5
MYLTDSESRIKQLKRLQRRSNMLSSVPISTIEDSSSSIAYTGLNNYAFTGKISEYAWCWTFGEFNTERPNPSTELTQELSAIVRYVRSGDVAPDEYVLDQLLKEVRALKERDVSSATVLRMAKQNLDEKKEKIALLQERLLEVTTALEEMKDKSSGGQDSAGQQFVPSKEQTIPHTGNFEQERQMINMKHQDEMSEQRKKHAEAMNAIKKDYEERLASADRYAKDAIDSLNAVIAMKDEQIQGIQGGDAESERMRQELAEKEEAVVKLQEIVSSEIAEREAMNQELDSARKQIKDLQVLLKQKSDEVMTLSKKGDLSRQVKEQSGAVDNLLVQLEKQQEVIEELKLQVQESEQQSEELAQCKMVIEQLEKHKSEVDGFLDSVVEERRHRDMVVEELKKLRIMVQQKDALIEELNLQLHNSRTAQDASGTTLFKMQQMSRDIDDLRYAVQERDTMIAELNARMQITGGGSLSRLSNISEREAALLEQTEQLRKVCSQQADMQRQLENLKNSLTDQQSYISQQFDEHKKSRSLDMQLSAQSQQLAAIQQGLNSLNGEGKPHSGQLNISAQPGSHELPAHTSSSRGPVNGSSVEVDRIAQGILTVPSPSEYSQSMGVHAAEMKALKASLTCLPLYITYGLSLCRQAKSPRPPPPPPPYRGDCRPSCRRETCGESEHDPNGGDDVTRSQGTSALVKLYKHDHRATDFHSIAESLATSVQDPTLERFKPEPSELAAVPAGCGAGRRAGTVRGKKILHPIIGRNPPPSPSLALRSTAPGRARPGRPGPAVGLLRRRESGWPLRPDDGRPPGSRMAGQMEGKLRRMVLATLMMITWRCEGFVIPTLSARGTTRREGWHLKVACSAEKVQDFQVGVRMRMQAGKDRRSALIEMAKLAVFIPSLALAGDDVKRGSQRGVFITEQDFPYLKGRYPPRRLDLENAPQQGKDKLLAESRDSFLDEAQDSCQYVPIKQRYDGYKKYKNAINQGSELLRQLHDSLGNPMSDEDKKKAEKLLRRAVLLADLLLISENYGTSNEALVSRFYVNEAYYASLQLAEASKKGDAERSKEMWELWRDSWNSYLIIINRAIVPKVGEKFQLIKDI